MRKYHEIHKACIFITGKLLRHSVTNVGTMHQTKLIESAELRIHDADGDDNDDDGIGIANGIVFTDHNRTEHNP